MCDEDELLAALARLDPSVRLSGPDGDGILWVHYQSRVGVDCADDTAGLSPKVRDLLFMVLNRSNRAP